MSKETENAEISEENDHDSEIVSLREVLQSQEDAVAVLGASNDKVCSYAEGYLPRQALYSCLTCIPEAKEDPSKGAGICLACCFHCHDGHDLIELYTKRNFRCDCGNSKFKGVKCNLEEVKDEINEKNVYNQNFGGVYCTCHRPYPDPEDELSDEMVQCIVCEDWYHLRHLGAEMPAESFAEMVCVECVKKHEFLQFYDVKRGDAEAADVAVEAKEGGEAPATANVCRKPIQRIEATGPKFFEDLSWRSNLCKCSACLDLYKTENVDFLVDSDDSVHSYEEKGKAKFAANEEAENRNFMNSMDRVQLVEVIAGYNDLKENFSEFCQKFAENKKVIREEDIREFFDGMQARKKQKVSVSHFCR